MTVISVTRIFIAVCLVGVALSARPGDPDFRCTPGQSFKDDCNTCTCTADGKSAACTLRACISKRQARQPGEEGYCTPGESFKKDCNTCVCSPNGKYAPCTLKYCHSSHAEIISVEKRQTRQPGEEGYCTPGTTFKDEDGCNTCRCTADGKYAACTLKLCPELTNTKQKRQARGQPGQEGYCTPGEQFKNDCNTCTCTPDGKNAFCTLIGCNVNVPYPIQHSQTKRQAPAPNTAGFSCNPGQSFKYECNDCTCANDGKTAACTFKLCGRKRRQAAAPNTPGFSCTPGETFKYQCNTCRCGSNGQSAACTYAACPSGTYRRKRQAECEDGQTKQQDCNSCHCAQGHWACTRKACPKVKRAAECQDGQNKQEDCNTCRCIQGGWACTRKFCPKTKRAAECQDGENKQEDCNTCKCVQGGWACTRKACPKVKRDAECQDGETKKQDCNTCRCIKGGWACTKIGCPKVKRDVEN